MTNVKIKLYFENGVLYTDNNLNETPLLTAFSNLSYTLEVYTNIQEPVLTASFQKADNSVISLPLSSLGVQAPNEYGEIWFKQSATITNNITSLATSYGSHELKLSLNYLSGGNTVIYNSAPVILNCVYAISGSINPLEMTPMEYYQYQYNLALNQKENLSNKVQDFTNPNSTTFPSTQAVKNELDILNNKVAKAINYHNVVLNAVIDDEVFQDIMDGKTLPLYNDRVYLKSPTSNNYFIISNFSFGTSGFSNYWLKLSISTKSFIAEGVEQNTYIPMINASDYLMTNSLTTDLINKIADGKALVCYKNCIYSVFEEIVNYNQNFIIYKVVSTNGERYAILRMRVDVANKKFVPLGAISNNLQLKIENANKLDADLVDDTTSTNKFVSASDIANWNNVKGIFWVTPNTTTYLEIQIAINNGLMPVIKLSGSTIYVPNVISGTSYSFYNINSSVINYYTVDNSDTWSNGQINLQTPLTLDNTPTQNSDNPVKSGGIYNELINKIDKNYTGYEEANAIGQNDYLVLNVGGVSKKISWQTILADIQSGQTEHFLGTYANLVALQTAHPTAISGDYAYITEVVNGDTIITMAIWDDTDNEWQVQDTSVYVKTSVFNAYQATVTNSLNGKQNKIDANNKLSADLVDDTNSTNKFVSASDKTSWNAKSQVQFVDWS